MAAPRIVIIEDEPAIADTLLYALRTEGFAPEWFATGGAGIAAVLAGAEGADVGPEANHGAVTAPVALVILDVGLPDGSGFELCRRLRKHSAVPVLFLTARGDEIDRVVGLEIGGDDYVTKPFSPREVTARVRAILRRGAGSGVGGGIASTGSGSLAGGTAAGRGPVTATGTGTGAGAGFSQDEERCEIRYGEAVLELTRIEYRLLGTLLSRPGRVWSRDELMTRAWDDPGASLDRTVDAHIKTLRAKLRAVAPGAEQAVVTHRGLGYSLRDTGGAGA